MTGSTASAPCPWPSGANVCAPWSRPTGMIQTLLQDTRYAVRLLLRSPGLRGHRHSHPGSGDRGERGHLQRRGGRPDCAAAVSRAGPPRPACSRNRRRTRIFRWRRPTFATTAPSCGRSRGWRRTSAPIFSWATPALPNSCAACRSLRGSSGSSDFQPALGREFEPQDEVAGQRRRGSFSATRCGCGVSTAIPGSWAVPVRLSGRMFRVVGVLPEGFQHVGGTYRTYGHGEAVDVWWVLTVPRDENPGNRFSHFFNVVGRVRTGVSRSAMEEDLRQTGKLVATRYPTPNSPWTARAVPLKDEIVGTAESTLVALAGAVTLVLAPCVRECRRAAARPGRGAVEGNRRPRRAGRDARAPDVAAPHRERRARGRGRRDRRPLRVRRGRCARAIRSGRHAPPGSHRHQRAGARLRPLGDGVQRAVVRSRAGVAAREHGNGGDAEAGQPPRRRIEASTDAPARWPRSRSRSPSCSLSRPACCSAASWRWSTRIPGSGPRARSRRPSSFRSRGTTSTVRRRSSLGRSRACNRSRACARRPSRRICRGPATTRTRALRSPAGSFRPARGPRRATTSSRPGTRPRPELRSSPAAICRRRTRRTRRSCCS